MHEKVLPRHTLALLTDLEALQRPELEGWTLAGGTGLALRIGHRRSDDLDFFRTDTTDVRRLHAALAETGKYETLQEAEHTLTVLLRRTKFSFFRVQDPFLFRAEEHRFFAIADVRDIALMKLAAIAGRGMRKDFIDLYSILRQPPGLREYFELMPRKYGANRVNVYPILKSLTYFADADAEPMPRMLAPCRWRECKAFFVREARTLVLP